MNDLIKILNKLTLGVADVLDLLIPAIFYFIVKNLKFCFLTGKVTPLIHNERGVKVSFNLWRKTHNLQIEGS